MRYKILDQNGLNFLTLTIVEWIDLFTRPVYSDIVIESLRYCQQEKGLMVFGYVLMPSHLHLIVRTDNTTGLSPIIQSFKSFTANQFLRYIKDTKKPESRREWLLNHFAFNARKSRNHSQHQFAGNMPIAAIDLDGLEPKLAGNANFNYAVALDNKTQKPFAWYWFDNKWNRGNVAFLAGNPEPSGSSDLSKASYPDKESTWVGDQLRWYSRTGKNYKSHHERLFLGHFVDPFLAATSLGWTDGDDVLLRNFIKGDGSPVQFDAFSGLSENISVVKNFQKFALNLEAEVLSYFNENGSLDGFQGSKFISQDQNKLGYLGRFIPITEVFSYAVLGGFAAVGVEILDINSKSVNIRYTITDHFGAGTDDSKRDNLPGLQELYLLQHYFSNGRSNLGNTYEPFIWSTIIEKRGNGQKPQKPKQPFIDIRKL